MIGALIGAAASGLGSILGKSAADKANKTQAKMAAQNIAMQKEFAQHGVRWKTEDAKRAGLHPLAALGMQPVSFNPVSIGTTTPDYSGVGQAGQDIGRAIDATRTGKERAGANNVLTKLAVERAGLENDLLRSQIAKNTQAGQPPARPSLTDAGLAGQGNSRDLVKTNPQERESSSSTSGAITPAAVPEVTFGRTTSGGYSVLPSKTAKELMEDQIIPETQWAARNLLLNPPKPPFAESKYMWYNRITGEWRYPRYRPRIPYYWSHHPARTGRPLD